MNPPDAGLGGAVQGVVGEARHLALAVGGGGDPRQGVVGGGGGPKRGRRGGAGAVAGGVIAEGCDGPLGVGQGRDGAVGV